MNYSASSFKRVTRALGAGWEKDRDLFEEATIEAVQIPETAERLAISVDRVSLPMAEEKGVKYRMAYCGAITMYDGQGEPLKTLRYGRMPAEGSSCLREQMRWDVEALLKRRPDLELICLSDGAAEMCNILDEEFPDAVRYIDYYHLVEKLGAAVTAYANHRPLRKTKDEIIATWQCRLLNEDDGIDTIEAAIKRWNATDIEVGDRKPVHEALTYLENHREQMNYAAARRQGHPIGSGHVEACCKQLVACRMKRSGQRWKSRGG